MVWNYCDDDVPGPDATVTLGIGGLPLSAGRVLVRHYRIDSDHSNAFTVWKKLGAPQQPSNEEYAELERAGQLELLTSPEWLWNQQGRAKLNFRLPREAVSLIELSW